VIAERIEGERERERGRGKKKEEEERRRPPPRYMRSEFAPSDSVLDRPASS